MVLTRPTSLADSSFSRGNISSVWLDGAAGVLKTLQDSRKSGRLCNTAGPGGLEIRDCGRDSPTLQMRKLSPQKGHTARKQQTGSRPRVCGRGLYGSHGLSSVSPCVGRLASGAAWFIRGDVAGSPRSSRRTQVLSQPSRGHTGGCCWQALGCWHPARVPWGPPSRVGRGGTLNRRCP